MGRRKVKRENIVRETDAEKGAKMRAESDLKFAESLRGDRDELITKLTTQDTEAEIGGIASADKAISEAGAGVGGYGAASDIQTAAALASNAVAVSTGVKDVSSELEGGRLGAVAGMLTKDKQISSGAGVKAASESAKQDIAKFSAGETKDRAKRGAIQSTVGGVISGALGTMQKNVADTGSPFFRSSIVDDKGGKMVGGELRQFGEAYQTGIFGGTRLGDLRAPQVNNDATQTGQKTKFKILT